MGQIETQAAEKIYEVMYKGSKIVFKVSSDLTKQALAFLVAKSTNKKESGEIYKMSKFLEKEPGCHIFDIPASLISEISKRLNRYGITFCVVDDTKDDTLTDDRAKVLVRKADIQRARNVLTDLHVDTIKDLGEFERISKENRKQQLEQTEKDKDPDKKVTEEKTEQAPIKEYEYWSEKPIDEQTKIPEDVMRWNNYGDDVFVDAIGATAAANIILSRQLSDDEVAQYGLMGGVERTVSSDTVKPAVTAKKTSDNKTIKEKMLNNIVDEHPENPQMPAAGQAGPGSENRSSSKNSNKRYNSSKPRLKEQIADAHSIYQDALSSERAKEGLNDIEQALKNGKEKTHEITHEIKKSSKK